MRLAFQLEAGIRLGLKLPRALIFTRLAYRPVDKVRPELDLMHRETTSA